MAYSMTKSLGDLYFRLLYLFFGVFDDGFQFLSF